VAGNRDAVRELLAAKASPDIRDGDFKVPLHLAIEDQQDELVDILLDSNANLNLGNAQIGLQSSPLLDAVYRRDCTLARKLIAAKADVDHEGKNGMTALHLAIRARNQELASMLVAAGCKTDLQALGMTATEFALKTGMTNLATTLGHHTSAGVGYAVEYAT